MPISKLKASSIASGTLDNARISLDAAEIPALPTSKITSGTFDDARIASSNVSQHATSFDDNKLVNDLSTLGLRVHTQENLNASNSNSASFDVFQDSSAISNLTNAVRNTSEYVDTNNQTVSDQGYLTGNQTSTFTMTTNGTWEVAPGTYLLDGSTSHPANVTLTNNASQSAGTYVRFDRGSGNSIVYTGVKFTRQGTGTQNGGTTWVWRGGNDTTNWTDLLTGQSWGGANPKEYTWTNTTAYRYLEFYNPNSFTSSNNTYEHEWQVKYSTVSGSFNATGSFTGNNITASSSTNKMGAVITYQDNAGTNTLNTDIVLQLSADGGSNYSTATLTALPDFATGIKMAKVNDLSVTAGSSLNYKISFANQAIGSKEARIRGVSLQY